MKFLPQKEYLKYAFEYYTGKKLNLDNPKEFNEKIQWYKAYYKPKILNQLADKYAVRKYVEEKIGNKYLNECLGVYDKINKINFDTLPNKFVLKAVHASSYNLVVKDKSKLNHKKVKRLLNKWMNTSQYYRTGLEWAYKDIKPRIIADKFLEEPNKEVLNDYKFFCFNGKPKFIKVDIDRGVENKRCFYDLDWIKQPYITKGKFKMYEGEIEKPTNLSEMTHLAEILADKFPFVRVDFYSIEGKTIFGEMTFYPADGRKDFVPDKYNKIIGDYFVLPKIPEGAKEITKY